jgi:hypothetical protein
MHRNRYYFNDDKDREQISRIISDVFVWKVFEGFGWNAYSDKFVRVNTISTVQSGVIKSYTCTLAFVTRSCLVGSSVTISS